MNSNIKSLLVFSFAIVILLIAFCLGWLIGKKTPYAPTEQTKTTNTVVTTAKELETTKKEETTFPPTKENTCIDLIPIETEEEKVEEEAIIEEPASTAEELFWENRKEKYPIATAVWLQMKSYGWTDAACAGIMGNMMREVGGGTLNLDPDLRYGSHYGLCQWTSRYYQEIFPHDGWAPTVYDQVAFLRHTILTYDRTEFPYNFTEEYLKTATDYREVAKKFCDSYERPKEQSTRRENYAEKAWKYFVLGEEK